MDQALSVHYFFELPEIMADLAAPQAQLSGLSAVDRFGGYDPSSTFRGPRTGAQAAMTAALGGARAYRLTAVLTCALNECATEAAGNDFHLNSFSAIPLHVVNRLCSKKSTTGQAN